MKKILSLIVIALFLFIGCDKDSADETKGESKIDTNDIFYAVGMFEARKIKQLKPTEKELEQVFKGIKDSVEGNPKMSDEELQQQMGKIQSFMADRTKEEAVEEKKKGEKYLKKFAKDDDVKVTESGLAYKIKEKGDGKAPKETDTVKVHYEGHFIDGEVFDSSKERGEPAVFPLNQVIPGWSEGIQLINEGGSIEIVIPSDLAYGDRGNPNVPGGSTLVFDIELLEVMPPEESPAENE